MRDSSVPRCVVAADIGGTHLRMMLADLDGSALARWSAIIPPGEKAPQDVCNLIALGLQVLCNEARVPRDRILHMTVGAPGITDANRGVVLAAPNLTGWIDVPLQDLIARTTGLAALIENDTNLAALGEHRNGAAAGIADFVFIAMGTGVGAGIFLNGKLHHGAAFSAGEIGYLSVAGLPRTPLHMADTGDLERAIGGEAIEQRWQAQLALVNRLDPQLAALRAPQIFDCAQLSDPDASMILESVAIILAGAIATLTLLLNPPLVVLGGGVGSHEALRDATARILAASDFPHPAVRISALGPQAQLYGAVALSLAAVESRVLC